MLQNSKTQIVTKPSNSNCDKIQKPKLGQKFKKIKLWWNSKTQIVTKIKKYNCDWTQKLKLWQIQNYNFYKTQKLKVWQNSKTQIVTKLRN